MKKITIIVMTIVLSVCCCSCALIDAIDAIRDKTVTVVRGEQDGNVYTNSSVNVTFTKTDEMIFWTDEEIAELMQIGLDQLKNGEDLAELVDVALIYEFNASDPSTNNGVMLVIENLAYTGSTKWSEEQYMQVSINQIKSQTNMNYSFSEISEKKLGKENYTFVEATVKTGLSAISQYIYVRKVGKYMLQISITSTDGTPLSYYEAMFS